MERPSSVTMWKVLWYWGRLYGKVGAIVMMMMPRKMPPMLPRGRENEQNRPMTSPRYWSSSTQKIMEL